MKLFTKAEQRYKINSFEFTRIRESIHFSVERFAEIVGWSASYQYKLESGKIDSISKKTAKEICMALLRCDVFMDIED